MKATLSPGAAFLPRAVFHATLALLMLAASALRAAERVALVVGCGAYSKLHALDTPAQDAKTLAETLAAAPLGFECITVTDATLDAFYEGLEKFKVQARGPRSPCSISAAMASSTTGRTTSFRWMPCWTRLPSSAPRP